MLCPVCGKYLQKNYSNNGGKWFAYHGFCWNCHRDFLVSGSVDEHGKRIMRSFIPECREHGMDSVFRIEGDQFIYHRYACGKCGLRMEVRNGRVIETRQFTRETLPDPEVCGRILAAV